MPAMSNSSLLRYHHQDERCDLEDLPLSRLSFGKRLECCRHINIDRCGVEGAVRVYYRLNPDHRRPGRTNYIDQILWSEITTRFLEASAVIWDPESPEASLPMTWVDLVERGQYP